MWNENKYSKGVFALLNEQVMPTNMYLCVSNSTFHFRLSILLLISYFYFPHLSDLGWVSYNGKYGNLSKTYIKETNTKKRISQ